MPWGEEYTGDVALDATIQRLEAALRRGCNARVSGGAIGEASWDCGLRYGAGSSTKSARTAAPDRTTTIVVAGRNPGADTVMSQVPSASCHT
jgi:hypothetical protein